MKEGTVKFFNESKGFGFITEEGEEKDEGKGEGEETDAQ